MLLIKKLLARFNKDNKILVNEPTEQKYYQDINDKQENDNFYSYSEGQYKIQSLDKTMYPYNTIHPKCVCGCIISHSFYDGDIYNIAHQHIIRCEKPWCEINK